MQVHTVDVESGDAISSDGDIVQSRTRLVISGQVMIRKDQVDRARKYGWRAADDQRGIGPLGLVIVERGPR